MEADASELNAAHVRNFLNCVKSRNKPNADVEEGHRTAVMCHLGNISMRLGCSLHWDVEKEHFINDAEADSWIMRPYRGNWSLT